MNVIIFIKIKPDVTVKHQDVKNVHRLKMLSIEGEEMNALPKPNVKLQESKRITKNEKLSGKELLKFMNHHGISEKELAEILGVTIQAVRLWLTNQREVSLMMSRLIRMFEARPNLIREF